MITTREAHDALQEAATAERRSAESYSYSRSAPYCILWGLIWMAGYGGMTVLKGADVGWLWLILSAIGAGVSIWIGNNSSASQRSSGWRIGLLFVIIAAFSTALFAILPPTNAFQVGAYSPLLLSAIYASLGLWLGIRYILLAVFVAAVTLGAFFFMREFFFVWMAVAGGGSLLLTGLWMRHG